MKSTAVLIHLLFLLIKMEIFKEIVKTLLSDYSAFDVRKLVILESEEGYLDLVRSKSPFVEFSNFKISGLKRPDV